MCERWLSYRYWPRLSGPLPISIDAVKTYTVLRAGLDGAVRDGLMAKNPAVAVKRPGIARREARHASAVDVSKLLLCADGLRYRNVLTLIAATGLRRGEALALPFQ